MEYSNIPRYSKKNNSGYISSIFGDIPTAISQKTEFGYVPDIFGIFHIPTYGYWNIPGYSVKNGIFQNMTKIVCPGFKMEYSNIPK